MLFSTYTANKVRVELGVGKLVLCVDDGAREETKRVGTEGSVFHHGLIHRIDSDHGDRVNCRGYKIV